MNLAGRGARTGKDQRETRRVVQRHCPSWGEIMDAGPIWNGQCASDIIAALMSTKADLVNLLVTLFNADELRRFVSYGPQGSGVEQSLSINSSLRTLADEIVAQYDRRGLINDEFRRRLIQDRPNRQVEIEQCLSGLVTRRPSDDRAGAETLPRPEQAPDRAFEYLLVTALTLEAEAVLAQLEPTDEILPGPGGTIVEIALLDDVRVGIVTTGAGNVPASGITSSVVTNFKPRAVVLIGVAGGIKDVEIGDVVVGTKVYRYESGKTTDKGFYPRPELGRSNHGLVQLAMLVSRRPHWLTAADQAVRTPKAFVKPIAAGEQVVASSRSDIAQRLKNTYGDALAVEMEGDGVLQAGFVTNVPSLVVRGISDLLDGKLDADATGSQPRAAQNATAFALEVLRNERRTQKALLTP